MTIFLVLEKYKNCNFEKKAGAPRIRILAIILGIKTSGYWYCLTRIRVAASQICQDILYHDYRLQY